MSILLLQMIGIIIALIGLFLCIKPELVSKKPIPEDTYKAIERRVWWGMVIGLGILLLFHHQVTPIFLSMAASGIAFTTGIIIARLIGIILDGSVAKQWFWVIIEIVILIPFIVWYGWQKGLI